MHRKRKVRQKGQSEGGAVETERRKKCEKQPAKGTLGATGQWGWAQTSWGGKERGSEGEGCGYSVGDTRPPGAWKSSRVKVLSRARLCESMEFSRPECWSG